MTDRVAGDSLTNNGKADVMDDTLDYVNTADALTCAIEAIQAHGNTPKIAAWYRRWMPKHYERWGLPTTVQYSLSSLFMEHANKLLTERLI